jgi:hypothetical protein
MKRDGNLVADADLLIDQRPFEDRPTSPCDGRERNDLLAMAEKQPRTGDRPAIGEPDHAAFDPVTFDQVDPPRIRQGVGPWLEDFRFPL